MNLSDDTAAVDDSDEEDDHIESESDTNTKESKANFMRILFSSCIINKNKVAQSVEKMWRNIATRSLNVTAADAMKVKEVFTANWDLISELFDMFSPSGNPMDFSTFQRFIVNIQLFGESAVSNALQIFTKSCVTSPDGMDLHGFCLSLIHLAQTRFHDIFFSKSDIMDGCSCLKEMFKRYIRPFAESYSFNAVLKDAFCSTNFMSEIRSKNDQLFLLFQRYLGKSKDLPTKLKFEIMSEVLFDCKLQKEEDFEGTKSLLKAIRKGSLNERENTTGYDFNFGEFVESIARSGCSRYRGTDDQSNEFEKFFMMGIDAALLLLNKHESSIRKYYY